MTGAALRKLFVGLNGCEISLSQSNIGQKQITLASMALTKAAPCDWKHQQSWTRAIWVRKPHWQQQSLHSPANTCISPSIPRWGPGSESLFSLRKKQVVWFTVLGFRAVKNLCSPALVRELPLDEQSAQTTLLYWSHVHLQTSSRHRSWTPWSISVPSDLLISHKHEKHGLITAWGRSRDLGLSLYPNALARAKCTFLFCYLTGATQFFPRHIRDASMLRMLPVFLYTPELFLLLSGALGYLKLCNGRAEA